MICLKERQQKEEEDRKQRIQLYVFVLRSIAYPFNAKQPGDMTKRHIKITKEGLEKLRARVEVWSLDILTMIYDMKGRWVMLKLKFCLNF